MVEERPLCLVDEVSAAPPIDLDALFRELAPYVATIGLRLLGRRDEADDLVQDVFLAAHRAHGKLRVRHEARRWLAVVTVRMARRRLRVRRLRGWLHLDQHAEDALVGRGMGPEDGAFLGQVYARLDRLPVNHRLAWTLRHLQGEELGTIAELLGCSLATVKRWIGAAQAELERSVGA